MAGNSTQSLTQIRAKLSLPLHAGVTFATVRFWQESKPAPCHVILILPARLDDSWFRHHRTILRCIYRLPQRLIYFATCGLFDTARVVPERPTDNNVPKTFAAAAQATRPQVRGQASMTAFEQLLRKHKTATRMAMRSAHVFPNSDGFCL